jgi:hypothetical protein
MAFGNFLRGIAAQINPFDKGKTYSSYNPKKRREDEPQQVQNTPTVQQPTNIINHLNDSLTPKRSTPFNIGLEPTNKVDVPQKSEYDNQLPPPPKQSFWNKVRDQFDANTEADQYRRAVKTVQGTPSNLPVDKRMQLALNQEKTTPYRGNIDIARDVQKNTARSVATLPLAASRVVTGLAESAMDITDLAARGVNAPINLVRKGTIAGSSDNIVSNIVGTVKDKGLNHVNRGLDRSAQVVGGDNQNKVYRVAQVGMTIPAMATGLGELAAAGKVAGLGGKGVSQTEKAIQASKFRSALEGVSKQLSPTSDAPGLVGSVINPIARGLDTVVNRPIRGLADTLGITLGKSSNVVRPASEIGDLLSHSDLEDIATTNIPVSQNIPVIDKSSEPNVVSVTRKEGEPSLLIRETSGDERYATPRGLMQHNIAEANERKIFDFNKENQPAVSDIYRFEGITPRNPSAPYKIDVDISNKSKDEIIDGYADMLRSIENGLKGGQLVPDNEAYGYGYKRISEHGEFYRKYFKENKRKPPLYAWKEEARRQLESGKASDEVQKAFNDTGDPEIQSLLSRGEQPDVPQGKPIQVREVKNIDVVDKTEVPQGLPEQPGKVRAATQTDKQAVRTQVEAEQPPIVPPSTKGERLSPDSRTDTVAGQQTSGISKQDESGLVYENIDPESTRIRERVARQVAKDNKELASEISRGKNKDTVLKINQSRENIAREIDQTTDDGLIEKFSSELDPSDVGNIFKANASMDRLSKLSREVDEAGVRTTRAQQASEALTNALRVLEESSGQSGRILRAFQINYHNLPGEAKVRYWEKRTGVDLQDSDRNAILNIIESAESDYNKAIDAIADLKAGVGNSKELRSQIDKLESNYALKNGVVLDALRDVKKADMSTGEKVGESVSNIGNFGRTAMLSGPSGRTFDMISTAGTAISKSNQANLSALIGKGINKITGKNFESKLLNPITVAKGGARGLKETWGDVRRGNTRVEDVKFLQNVNRGDLNRPAGIATRFVHGMVKTPDSATRGIKDAHLERLGYKAGKESGLEGKELKEFSKNYKYFASPEHIAKADREWEKTNMMHDNVVTRALEGAVRNLGGGATKDSSVGHKLAAGLIKNAVLPFTRYSGGMIHTLVTEKNVVARSTNLIKALRRQDGQGIIDEVAGLANDTAETALLTGVAIPLAGGELVDHDANGNKYDGVYIKFGNNYVPANLAGVMAPSLIAGYAYNKTIGDNGWTPQQALDFMTEYGVKSVATIVQNPMITGDTALGKGVEAVSAINQATDENSEARAKDKMWSVAQQAVSPYTNPSILRDASSVLDSTSMNPTHEAPQTVAKKENPNTGREVVDNKQTAINRFKSGIPVLSQSLDRKEGQNAQTFVDRSLHRTRATEAQNEARAEEQKKQDQKQTIAKRDKDYRNSRTPSTSDGIRKSFEDGDIDGAIRGEEWAMAKAGDDGELSKKTHGEYEERINRLKTAKDYNLSVDDVDEYKSVDVSEWRKLADTDPERYQKLWAIDEAMAKSGASFAKGDNKKQKYSVKKSGSGGGRSGSGSRNARLSADFGKLTGVGSNAPKVRGYQTMEQATSKVPIIKRVQPNIVHTIRSGRV